MCTKSLSSACRVVTVLVGFVSLAFSQGGFDGPGWYQITNLKSGKGLAMDMNDQSSVTQFAPQNTENQVWILDPAQGGYFYIRNAVNGNALEPTAGQNSAVVLAAPFHATPSQQWRIERGKDGNALIMNYYGKALDLPDGSARDGVRMQIYDSNGDSNQRYTFRRVSGEYGSRWRKRDGDRPQGTIITCSSDDGRRKVCEVDTRGGVRLSRQISGSPCRENETWGSDRRGIWVDRGCRAEFEVGRR
ncbi:MAG TPA: RICIN domain-containing protein [Bryobacteraceae bacterium]|nr:RICIN domain-containing protein [Bryobacteraceae bacterium]